METINYNTNSSHTCEKVPEIISLTKDIEGVEKRVVIIESKQVDQDKYTLELRDFRTVQMETNKYLSKVVEQNAKLLDKIEENFDKETLRNKDIMNKLEEKYDKDIKDNTEKIHSLEIFLINENNKQNENSSLFKWNSLTKGLTWIIGIILTCIGLFLKFK